ncbi:rod shape-determining protein MreC [Paracrocinitomix mangrovi]|uniref:rod shape-determining protein MreC n=1 Tax=Paracrocinitomix mangrovi TaxID=2862509 RepID=UPI001C8E8AF1|nr:rod shape-determining protein MreC [Paracrocinitomix mangrovi]UKN00682.1 rod shape-determining protein MreC [Paracrocinitomix mangrovi]
MRRLLQFLKKFRDFIIFLLLQVFVLTFFFNSKNFHKAQMINTSNGVVGWFVEKKHNITKHFSLSDANDSLAAENAQLRALLPESFYKLQDKLYYVNDTLYEQQYQYIEAQVINASDNKRDNYFTLNKGTKNGVEEGMGVVSKNGTIGFVTDASAHYSIVKTLLSENINVAVKLRRNNEHWLLKWDGKDNEIVQLNGVTHDIDISEGDTVVTWGNKGIFPENQVVGYVNEIFAVDGKPTINVNVKLAVKFSAIYHVYVVKNLFKKEQDELEGDLFNEQNEQ